MFSHRLIRVAFSPSPPPRVTIRSARWGPLLVRPIYLTLAISGELGCKTIGTHCALSEDNEENVSTHQCVERRLRCWVDQVLRQDGHTKDMIFSVPYLIHVRVTLPARWSFNCDLTFYSNAFPCFYRRLWRW